MSLSYNVSGKIAVVTGGAIGLGAAITEQLLKESAKVVAIFDILEDKSEHTVNRLNAKYGENRAQFIKCDVTDEEQLSSAYQRVMETHQRIDIVFNNAGIFDENEGKHKKTITLNFTSVVDSTLKAMELMRADRGGCGGVIVNISSVAALVETHLFPVYGATKAAILYYSNVMGVEAMYSKMKVRMLVICLGGISTTILDGLKYKCVDIETGVQLESFNETNPPQSPEDAARACVEVLCKGESSSTWSVVGGVAADISDTVRAGRISM